LIWPHMERPSRLTGAAMDPSVHVSVPDPDLSMEVQDWLSRGLTTVQAECLKVEASLQSVDTSAEAASRIAGNIPAPTPVRGSRHLTEEECSPLQALHRLRMQHADAAISGMIATMRTFHPDVTPEELSQQVHRAVHSDAITSNLNPGFKDAIREKLPRRREDWLAADVERHLAASRPGSGLWRNFRRFLRAMVQDPDMHIVVRCAAIGAVIGGALGCAFGLAVGAYIGAAFGAVLAVFTFGLSILAGMIIGGGVAGSGCTLAGGTAGLLLGAFAGTVLIQAKQAEGFYAGGPFSSSAAQARRRRPGGLCSTR